MVPPPDVPAPLEPPKLGSGDGRVTTGSLNSLRAKAKHLKQNCACSEDKWACDNISQPLYLR